jgi:hypothetical protein
VISSSSQINGEAARVATRERSAENRETLTVRPSLIAYRGGSKPITLNDEIRAALHACDIRRLTANLRLTAYANEE